MGEFKVVSNYSPRGDQPKAIDEISNNIISGEKHQTLLGVTGSGKTFTVANIIEKVKKPTLVIAHNKTLAGQLYSEFKEFFPENAVEFFVSYYDYYQPEAYVAHTDTYIEKDSSINDEIDKLRHSATAALLERKDVVIIASVSCIYGLGNPVDYKEKMVSLRPGMEISRDDILKKLINIQYTRNDMNFIRGSFRVRGDVIEIIPIGEGENAIRVEMFGDEIEKIKEINSLTGEIIGIRNHISIFPATHYVVSSEDIDRAVKEIEEEMENAVKNFESEGKLIEAQRIRQRTLYDIEMIKELGYCQGIENYSRILYGRPPGSRPFTLIDFFPEDFLIVVDESHVTLPQIRGMFGGDRSRKNNLVDYGFRLPSALDNRPLNFEEFESLVNQIIYVSATPGDYEINHSGAVVEQIIRPTGLLDPEVDVRPIDGQIDDLYKEITDRVDINERVLVTTLTKKMAEDLTTHFKEMGIKVRYLHSDIKTMERMEIIKELREGKFDVLVGINLLREGLDIPEVSLVAILDADKEGFLRSETSLIQTIGRAARNVNGKVIMYADKVTRSMEVANKETDRRRGIQEEYNIKNDIKPQTIVKDIRKSIEATMVAELEEDYNVDDSFNSEEELNEYILELEEEMKVASSNLQFERAAEIRDKILELKEKNKLL
jgi:excinuclease ABC subunit B